MRGAHTFRPQFVVKKTLMPLDAPAAATGPVVNAPPVARQDEVLTS